MRRLRRICAAAVVMLLVTAPAQAASCEPQRGERIFASNNKTRLLSDGHAGVVGCHRATGRRTRLTDGAEDEYSLNWRGRRAWAGSYLVFDWDFSEGAGTASHTSAVDLRTGRRTHLASIQINGDTVERVFVTTKGRLAALRHRFSGPGDERRDIVICRVGVCNADEHKIDDGTHIVPDSLRRRGTRACWTIRTVSGRESRCTSLIHPRRFWLAFRPEAVA
jgi:hypothetical protein